MRCRLTICALSLSVLAACGGGGGTTGGPNPPIVHTTPTPASTPSPTPAPYATMAPASTRQGDIKTLYTGGGASAIGYWPDYNVLVVGEGDALLDPGDNSTLATAPDGNAISAITYSSSNHTLYFATPTDIYSTTTGGPVLTVAINMHQVLSLAVASDGTLYAFDTDHIAKISGGVPVNVTAPGALGAQNGYAYPAMAFANDGSLLVSDPANDAIDRVSTAGSVTPFAGSCKAGFGGFTGTNGSCWPAPQPGTGASANFGSPGGLAYDSATGTLYVADGQNNQLWAVSSSAVARPVAGYGAIFNADGNGLAAFLNGPRSLTFVPSTNSIGILESGGSGAPQEVAAFTASGRPPPAFTPPAVPFYFTNGLAISDLAAAADGSAWSAEQSQRNIVHISASGSVTRIAEPAGISPTWHVVVDATGNAWFLASHMTNGFPSDQGVLEVTPSATETYVAAPPQHAGASNFVEMQDITIGPDGNPWFTESETSLYGGSYGFENPSTHAMTQYATSTMPSAISQAPGGTLAIGTMVGARYGILQATTGGQTTTSYQVGINGANGLQYRASDSSLWFTDTAQYIGTVNSSGAEQDNNVCSNCDPVDLTIAPDASIWSDEGNWPGAMIRIAPNGTVSQYLLPISFGPTYGIAARPDGKLWVYNNFGILYLFDPAAYDAMNGPHTVQAMSRGARAGKASSIRMRWVRR